MTIASVLLVASSFAYAGFQWTIRVLVYPQFASVPADAFVAFERAHQHRVSIAVGPLFAFFGASVVAALFTEAGIASGVVAGCYVAILLVTALAAVPQHRRLTSGFDPSAHSRLLFIDSVRLGLALLACAAAVVYAS